MSRSNSTSTFHHNDRVEALWPQDGKWYPARVCKVLAGKMFRIRFDGFSHPHDCQAHEMRLPTKGNAGVGGGNQRPSAKQAAPAPSSPATFNAETPAFAPPSSKAPADALRFFEAFMSSVQRPSHAADHYAALKLAPNCGADEIKGVQRRMSLDWHTDKAIRRAEGLVPAATERRSEVVHLVTEMLAPIHEEEIRFLNQVKEDLTDAKRRKEYDAEQAARFAARQVFSDLGRFEQDLNAFFASGAVGTFQYSEGASTSTCSNGGDFVRNSSQTSKRNKMGGQVAEAVRAAVADAEARFQEEMMSQAADAEELRAEVQRCRSAAEAAQVHARVCEQQSSRLHAQMQREQTQSAAMIAELKDQVQRLTVELSSSEAIAGDKLEAQHQEELKAKAQDNNRLRARLLRLTNAKESAARRSAAEKMKLKARVHVLGVANAEARADSLRMQSHISAMQAAGQQLQQQLSAAQTTIRVLEELISALVVEARHHDDIKEEQVKQALAVQQCGA